MFMCSAHVINFYVQFSRLVLESQTARQCEICIDEHTAVDPLMFSTLFVVESVR